ncbi:uncharacterized protein LOC143029082 isoform X2 [Oratosquilla oratoria]|uniref:uncharacterized protein LOC143029082 isoform X2 n=1 Tax=Oratosquilla oratoria TaxID=337810 RepID=UPI003F774D41
MTMDCLPYEILVKIFDHLGVSDLLIASRVCWVWYEATSVHIAEKTTVMITDDAGPALELLSKSSRTHHHWVFKEVSFTLDCKIREFWKAKWAWMKSVGFFSVLVKEEEFIELLSYCVSLRILNIGSRHLFRPGTLLSNPEDVTLLSKTLLNVTHLHLACSRYLTDAIFSRMIAAVGKLRKLSLAGCQVSFQKAIYKRFYPEDGRVKASDHVLTFQHILTYITENASHIKEISLGRTSIDSESLYNLSVVPNLTLESVHLMSCDQLTKSGVQLLCENQKNITDLDLSLSSRLTDHAVIAVCRHLSKLKSLNLRRCQGITEHGIRELSQLKCLESLDISHLISVTSESLEHALGKEQRPLLRWLNLGSLGLNWQTVVSIVEQSPNLQHLDLSLCTHGVVDKCVQTISKSLPHLKYLNLNGCALTTDIGYAGHSLGQSLDVNSDTLGIGGLSLEGLGLKVKDPYKVPLGLKAEREIHEEAEIKKYLELNIHEFHSTGYGIVNLIGLQELNLCGCVRVTDLTLIHALHLRELKYLNLSHCPQIGEAGLIMMAKQCPSLEVLLLVEVGNTTDGAILAIAHHLKRIKTLDLQRCVLLTNDALDSLGSGCPGLHYLDVSGCTNMTLEEVFRLQQRLPRLVNLHHRGITTAAQGGNSDDEWEEDLECVGDKELKRKKKIKKKMKTPPPPPPLPFSKLKKHLSIE